MRLLAAAIRSEKYQEKMSAWEGLALLPPSWYPPVTPSSVPVPFLTLNERNHGPPLVPLPDPGVLALRASRRRPTSTASAVVTSVRVFLLLTGTPAMRIGVVWPGFGNQLAFHASCPVWYATP